MRGIGLRYKKAFLGKKKCCAKNADENELSPTHCLSNLIWTQCTEADCIFKQVGFLKEPVKQARDYFLALPWAATAAIAAAISSALPR